MKKLALLLLLLPITAFADDHIVRRIHVGGTGGWDYVTIDSSARRLYQSHGDHVVVLDRDKHEKVGEIADTHGVHGVALAPARGFVSAGRTNEVVVCDGGSLKP